MKILLRVMPVLICFLLAYCSETNPCDISIVFPDHKIVEQGGWQEIYFIPYSNEIANCNDLIELTEEQLENLSETYATVPIILSSLTGKDFSKLTHNRYYIVVHAKDLKCNFQWERCTDVDLETECRASLEILMNEKTDPVECDGLCMEGSCEIIACENDGKCLNTNICDGDEYCGEDNICHNGEVVENGYECNSDDNITTEEICVSGYCVERRCGDGFVENVLGEECDPPNALRCSENCKWINGADAGSDTDFDADIVSDITQDIYRDNLIEDTYFDESMDILQDYENDFATDIVSDTTPDTTLECIDSDGDNYGENCLNGPDCDDTSNLCNIDCSDTDNDSVFDCKEDTWILTIGGFGMDKASSVIETSDNGFLVAGYTDSYGAGNYDMWVMKINSSGEIGSCDLINDTTVTSQDTAVTPQDTTVTSQDSTATSQNSSVTPQDSTAVPEFLCPQ